MGDAEPRNNSEPATATDGEGPEPGDVLDATTGEGSAEPCEAEDAGPEDLDDDTALCDDTALGNAAVLGRLTLHYESRDVRFYLDGAAAMRLLTMFARRREGNLAERLTHQSSAMAGWLVLDLDEPLAMSWSPGVGRPARTALDPLIAAAP